MTEGRYVTVAVALPVKGLFTYGLPEVLVGVVQSGHVVAVPFGRKTVTAYVIGTTDTLDFDPKKVKLIDRLFDSKPAFDSIQLKFFEWISAYYLSPLGEVIATALPSSFRGRSKSMHFPSDAGVDALASGDLIAEAAEVFREIVSRPGVTRKALTRRLRDLVESDLVLKGLDSLIRKSYVYVEQGAVVGPKAMVRVIRLAVGPSQIEKLLPRRGKRQDALIASLTGKPEGVDLSLLVSEHGPYARTSVRKLLEVGVADESERELRDAVTTGELPADATPPNLTPAQSGAVEDVLGPPRPWLLHGVTGSGKTEVYLHAAAQVLREGKDVLVLVPEIGLTPLLTGRFRARFGDDVAVLHSGLTSAQRLREWRRIRAGEARVTIGARSALFAPFQKLGLIVVDEEHDDSYKQDDGVRYSARDMAVVRGALAKCPVVLGSATPSVESYQNAAVGRYGLIQLLTRPTPKPVPEVELIDMTKLEKVDGRPPLMSPQVQQALTDCFAAGDKAIVLYNRRGFATFVQCVDCGGAYKCPSCNVSLVLHQQMRTLSCHYCGFHRKYKETCPQCSGSLEIRGQGTERVESSLKEVFPDIPISRMDADSTSSRGSHHQILAAFQRGDSRLLVGTQIVAKGHDFPDVTLAVVLGADHTLMMPDFRAAERSFSLLTQLAGRAGRGSSAGRVLVQTHHPEHFALQCLGDYSRFFEEESRTREVLGYPPFSRLALVRFEGVSRGDVLFSAREVAERLRGTCDGRSVQVLGPAPAALPRLLGRWRYQIILRGMDASLFRKWMSKSDLAPKSKKSVRVVVDVDPRHLM